MGRRSSTGAIYVRPVEHSSCHIGLVRVLGIIDRYCKPHDTGDTCTGKCEPRVFRSSIVAVGRVRRNSQCAKPKDRSDSQASSQWHVHLEDDR